MPPRAPSLPRWPARPRPPSRTWSAPWNRWRSRARSRSAGSRSRARGRWAARAWATSAARRHGGTRERAMIPGVRVGHATDAQALTGCTVILTDRPAVGGVEIRGWAAGVHGLEFLDPRHLVPTLDGVVLGGGGGGGVGAG